MGEIIDLTSTAPPPKSARGKLRHAVYPHTEHDERHGVVRSWQVWRHGVAVSDGWQSRSGAQDEANRRNLAEFGSLATSKRREVGGHG